MNKFVVWDKKNKRFLDGDEFAIDDNGKVYNWDSDSYLKPFKQNMELLNYIGKNDINNNKIYADCSIVEFEWKISGLKKVGYFYYSNEYLCYMIKWVSEYTSDVLFYDKKKKKNFKIIDTIQENKLGLIKE
mgnify:CR=1 FL=1